MKLVFEEPGTFPFVGLAFALLFFVLQLLFCFKAKKRWIKLLPALPILWQLGFALLICTGIFGKGSGLGNLHLLVATLIAIVAGIASLGLVAAWGLYGILSQKKHP